MDEQVLALLNQYIEAAKAMKEIDWSAFAGGGDTMMEVIDELIDWALNVRDHSED